jgi:hypothetical protein
MLLFTLVHAAPFAGAGPRDWGTPSGVIRTAIDKSKSCNPARSAGMYEPTGFIGTTH